MKIYRIYKCTNIINNKVYIGFTNKDLRKRIIEHNCCANKNSNFVIHKAIKKYGVESFIWETIYESLDKTHTVNVMECYFIKEYDSYYLNNKGYNMTYGGESGTIGRQHSEKTKNKLKESRNKRKEGTIYNV